MQYCTASPYMTHFSKFCWGYSWFPQLVASSVYVCLFFFSACPHTHFWWQLMGNNVKTGKRRDIPMQCCIKFWLLNVHLFPLCTTQIQCPQMVCPHSSSWFSQAAQQVDKSKPLNASPHGELTDQEEGLCNLCERYPFKKKMDLTSG